MIVRLYRRLRRFAALGIRAPQHVEQLQRNVEQLQIRLGDLVQMLGSLEQAITSSIADRANRIERDVNSLKQVLVLIDGATHAASAGRTDDAGAPPQRVAEPTSDPSCDEIFQLLQRRYPKAYPLWKRLFANALDTYLQNPNENLSTSTHAMAPRFADYVTRYAFGRTLDIGCGPLSLPCYLARLDPAMVAGIDPLVPTEEHPFAFRHGVGEAIPWGDATFETVIAATSLDHVISIRATLDEIRRVLSDRGRFITWVGYLRGGRPFDPEQDNPASVDDYHLFHFDEEWMEEMFAEYFWLEDRLPVAPNQAFYVFRKMDTPGAAGRSPTPG
jgi:SAM-dependent methyltransferase